MDEFCIILKNIRIKRKLSQKAVFDGICDKRTYIHWERGDVLPSFHNMHMLSNRLNYDFISYYYFSTIDTNEEEILLKKEGYTALSEHDIPKLLSIIMQLEQLFDSLSLNTKQALFYYKAHYTFDQKNYDKTVKLAFSGIQYENPNATLEDPRAFSNTGLCLTNLIACTYIEQNFFEQGFSLIEYMLTSIKELLQSDFSFYQSKNFEHKFYSALSYNLGLLHKKQGNATKALEAADNGISFLTTNHSMVQLYKLYFLKADCWIQLENIPEALHNFQLGKSLLTIASDFNLLDFYIKDFQKDYPDLKDSFLI